VPMQQQLSMPALVSHASFMGASRLWVHRALIIDFIPVYYSAFLAMYM